MMKVVIFVLSIAMASNMSFAQEVNEKEGGKVSLGLFISPTLNYRILTSDASNDFIKTVRDESESSGFRYQGGITLDLKLSERLGLQSGLVYADRVFKTNSIVFNWEDNSEPSITEAFFTQQYQYIEIPFQLKHDFLSTEKMNYFCAAGFTGAFLISHKQNHHVRVNNNWERSSSELLNERTFMLMADLALGMEYKFKSLVKMRSSINLQQGIRPTNPDYPTKEYLNAAGLRLGIVFTTP